jgi:hypothetical protein
MHLTISLSTNKCAHMVIHILETFTIPAGTKRREAETAREVRNYPDSDSWYPDGITVCHRRDAHIGRWCDEALHADLLLQGAEKRPYHGVHLPATELPYVR